MVKFSIAYEGPLSAISVEERAKIPLEELVGTLGGHLHLLLGMTLLSFLELFELGTTVCVVHACRRSDEKEENEDHPSSSFVRKCPSDNVVTSSNSSRNHINSLKWVDKPSSNRSRTHNLTSIRLRSNDSAISFDSVEVSNEETATILSSGCQQTTKEDQKFTTNPPSVEIQPNEDVQSDIGTTTATKTGAAIDSASCVATSTSDFHQFEEQQQQQHDQTLWLLLVVSIKQVKIDALSNIFHSRWLAFKACWLLLLIILVGVCTALVVASAGDYFKGEVILVNGDLCPFLSQFNAWTRTTSC